MNFLKNLFKRRRHTTCSTVRPNINTFVSRTSNGHYDIVITSNEPVYFEKVIEEVDIALARHICKTCREVDNNLIIKPNYLEYRSPHENYIIVITWNCKCNSGSPEEAKGIVGKAKEDIEKKKQCDKDFCETMKRLDENLREVLRRFDEDMKMMSKDLCCMFND